VQILNTLIQWGGILALATLVLIAMPQSKLREFLMPIVAGLFAVGCGVYVISPLDIVPDVIPVIGWIDDAGAAVLGIGAAMAALTAKKR
jgi:uncharacterized membrane protein YkvA (DUF1232 family)